MPNNKGGALPLQEMQSMAQMPMDQRRQALSQMWSRMTGNRKNKGGAQQMEPPSQVPQYTPQQGPQVNQIFERLKAIRGY